MKMRSKVEWWNTTDQLLQNYKDVDLQDIVERSRARGDAVDFWRLANAEEDLQSIALAIQRSRGFADWPKGLQAAVDRTAQEATLKFVGFEEATIRLAGFFQKHGVQALLGGALACAYRYYPEPFLRPVQTVEWVVPGQIDFRLMRHLGRAGYRQVGAARWVIHHMANPEIHLELRAMDVDRFQSAWAQGSDLVIPGGRSIDGRPIGLRGLSSVEDWLESVRQTAKNPEAAGAWDWVDLELRLRESVGSDTAWNWQTVLPALMHGRGVATVLQALAKDRKVNLPKPLKQFSSGQMFQIKRFFEFR